MEGFDYAWGWSTKLPAALKKAGAGFVVRYLGTSSKCLTSAEVRALHAAGIAIGLVYETTGQTFSGGESAGINDGNAARAAAERLGVPTGTPIWFAIDTDTTDYAAVRAYLKGCATGAGAYPARLYAGYHVIEAVASHGHWQTYAWSGGHVSAYAGLYQYHNGVTVGGVSADRDRTLAGGPTASSGWLTYAAPAAPAPKPNPVTKPVTAKRDRLRVRGNRSPLAAAAVKYMKGQVASGGSGWKNMCAKLVRVAFGRPASAWPTSTRTAAAAWHDAPAADRHTWYNPPIGVPVFWTGGASGAGHVGIADGNGNVWQNDFGPSGYIGDGRVRLVPIAAISAHDKALVYAGWSESYLGARVYS